MRTALVTGAAGFLGSHLVDSLLASGWRVVGLDDLSTGRLGNLSHASRHPGFRFAETDAATPPDLPYERVYHLGCAASPIDFGPRSQAITHACGPATHALLERCEALGARFLLASSSEVYGEPGSHPQHEDCAGWIDPSAARAVYAEGKRRAEALARRFAGRGVEVRIARLFNSYGPRMRPDDGRVVVTFLVQALGGRPLTVHGDGGQTRSLCYVDDTVRGLRALMASSLTRPCNLGRAEETPIGSLAQQILALTGSNSGLRSVPRPSGDPSRRCPDLRLARRHLGWQASIPLREGLRRTRDALLADADYKRNCTPAMAPIV